VVLPLPSLLINKLQKGQKKKKSKKIKKKRKTSKKRRKKSQLSIETNFKRFRKKNMYIKKKKVRFVYRKEFLNRLPNDVAFDVTIGKNCHALFLG